MLNWLTNWGRKPAVDPLEEKLKILEAELRDRLQESLNYYGLPGVPYPGSLDFLRPGMSDDWGFGYRNRNRRGDNPQVYLHDEQLKQVRERSRDLAARNEYARNALRVRQTYIVGTGLRTTAMPRKNLEDDARAVAAADEVQSFLEVWAAYTKLYPKQKEFQLRKDRDGEAFIRLFRGKRFLEYNFIEPEHVVDYTGQYTFGIETDPDDITKIIAYYVRPDEQGQPEKVDAEKVIHIKANVDSGIKRGLPFLYPIFNVLEKIESADENMAAIMKIQGSIAMIRRHQVARSSAVSSGVSSRADYTGNNPMTGATDNYKLYRPGTILDVDNNTEYEFPAIAANLAHMADGKSSLLRSAAAGVGMPEYMLTADAANGNFASTQVAESPAIADFLGLQHDTGEVFGAGVYVDGADNGLSWAAIAYAVEQGELNPDVLELVTLKSEGPNIVVRDRNQETQRLSLLADKGIISRDEWAKAEGREKAAQTDEEVQAAKDAEMQKQMALKQPAGKPVVKEAFDEDQHPRDDAGKFTFKSGDKVKKATLGFGGAHVAISGTVKSGRVVLDAQSDHGAPGFGGLRIDKGKTVALDDTWLHAHEFDKQMADFHAAAIKKQNEDVAARDTKAAKISTSVASHVSQKQHEPIELAKLTIGDVVYRHLADTDPEPHTVSTIGKTWFAVKGNDGIESTVPMQTANEWTRKPGEKAELPKQEQEPEEDANDEPLVDTHKDEKGFWVFDKTKAKKIAAKLGDGWYPAPVNGGWSVIRQKN